MESPATLQRGSAELEATPHPKRPPRLRFSKEVFAGYVLVLPAVAVVGLILAFPVANSVWNSFRSNGQFVGVQNYHILVTDHQFTHAFLNNLILLTSIPIRLVVALVITALLYRRVFASRLYEVLIFLPFIPSIAAIGVLFIYMLNANGPANALLRLLGLGFLARPWLDQSNLTMWTIMGVVVWTRIGFTVLLFMARLLGVDREQFQAAFVDGASWAKTFWHVAMPELKGTIEFVVVLSVIEAFSWSFAYVYVLGQGPFDPSRWILEIYLYNKEFLASLQGLASAVAVFMLLLAVLLAIYRYRMARDVLA